MTEGPLLWFVNRGSGLVLLMLLTLAVALGVLSTGGRPGRGVPRFVTQALHRNVALLAVVALVVHVATAVLDTFVDIRWWHAFVPWGSGHEPLWTGLGALALDLMAVVVLTSLLRTRLAYRTWRLVHLASWLAWLLAVAHAIGAGTDLEAGRGWAVVPTLVCVLAVVASAAVRLFHLVRDQTPAGSVR